MDHVSHLFAPRVRALRLAALSALVACPAAQAAPVHAITELQQLASFKLGKTADWVAIDAGAVWVGSTGPNAVHRIDPSTNRLIATVLLPGEPCAGLALGFGALWVPLCGTKPALARIDLHSNALRALPLEGVVAEGGIAASDDSLWLVLDKNGTMARIDPASGKVRQKVALPPGSYNPLFVHAQIWVTHVEGAGLTVVDAATGSTSASVVTGPAPRFLAAGDGAVWTLNQGDGTLSRIDQQTLVRSADVALHTPGHGGDIAYYQGVVWTTMAKMPLSATSANGKVLCQWAGAGGDSLGIGYGSIWLTDYHGGTVARIGINETLKRCQP